MRALSVDWTEARTTQPKVSENEWGRWKGSGLKVGWGREGRGKRAWIAGYGGGVAGYDGGVEG